jgi:hypothetical protein
VITSVPRRRGAAWTEERCPATREGGTFKRLRG